MVHIELVHVASNLVLPLHKNFQARGKLGSRLECMYVYVYVYVHGGVYIMWVSENMRKILLCMRHIP